MVDGQLISNARLWNLVIRGAIRMLLLMPTYVANCPFAIQCIGGRVITLNCNHNNNLFWKNMLLTRTKRAYKNKSTC